jgi:hypothetical protein
MRSISSNRLTLRGPGLMIIAAAGYASLTKSRLDGKIPGT